MGRSPISRNIRELIQTIVRANPLWRAPRIHGELLKLGIKVSERGQLNHPALAKGLRGFASQMPCPTCEEDGASRPTGRATPTSKERRRLRWMR